MSPRKRPGRPPRGDKAATERIEIRVTRLEFLEFQRAALADGISVSEWIRQCCGQHTIPWRIKVLQGVKPTDE
jgi:hypothetical protein